MLVEVTAVTGEVVFALESALRDLCFQCEEAWLVTQAWLVRSGSFWSELLEWRPLWLHYIRNRAIVAPPHLEWRSKDIVTPPHLEWRTKDIVASVHQEWRPLCGDGGETCTNGIVMCLPVILGV